MTKIIQISDPHIVPHGQLAYGQVDTAKALASCVETVNRILPDIDPVQMVVVTGDLTDFGTPEEYDRFRMIMAPLKVPYRAIPGNHDNLEAMRTAFDDQDWMPATGPIDWMQEFDDLALIALDSHIDGTSHGDLSVGTLEYLATRLAQLQEKPVIVAVHHPPIITGIEKMDFQNLRDCNQFKSILSSYQGELRLVCGHVHRNIVAPFGSVICQLAPGVSHAVSMDQRAGAPNCLTQEPGAFLMHELRNGITSHSIPVGQFDGPHLFYPDKA